MSTLPAAPAADPVPRATEPATLAAGGADRVAKTASPPDPTPAPVKAKRVANASEQAAAGSGGLLWPVLIVGLLILLYAGARVVLGPVELDIFRSSPLRRVRREYPRA